jgi:hypothetical protein
VNYLDKVSEKRAVPFSSPVATLIEQTIGAVRTVTNAL